MLGIDNFPLKIMDIKLPFRYEILTFISSLRITQKSTECIFFVFPVQVPDQLMK